MYLKVIKNTSIGLHLGIYVVGGYTLHSETSDADHRQIIDQNQIENVKEVVFEPIRSGNIRYLKTQIVYVNEANTKHRKEKEIDFLVHVKVD